MTKDKPIISAVIPCYNNAKYVGKSIQSLLGQTLVPDEIIVVDDGSTDNSWDVIQEMANNHPRITAFRNDKNLGIPKTRNRLIREMKSNTDYMVILDADDFSSLDRIELQINYLEQNPEYVLIGSDLGIVNEKGEKIGFREYPHEHKEILKKILHFNPFAQSSLVVRTKIFKDVGVYDEKLQRVQDYDLWIRILKAGYKVHNINKTLTFFRRHKGQGKEILAKKSIFYSLKVRARYIFKPKFFSIKGLIIFIFYFFIFLLPNKLISKFYNVFFVEK